MMPSEFKEEETAIKKLTDPDELTEIANSNDTHKYVYKWETNECMSCGDCTRPFDRYAKMERCNLFYQVTEHTLDLRETARERLAELRG
ncbi:MAG: hypothetical protein FWE54_06100 [Methanimicrococcus sp.]|nr:hypothetical protein [Methanimicrococcus sp.]